MADLLQNVTKISRKFQYGFQNLSDFLFILPCFIKSAPWFGRWREMCLTKFTLLKLSPLCTNFMQVFGESCFLQRFCLTKILLGLTFLIAKIYFIKSFLGETFFFGKLQIKSFINRLNVKSIVWNIDQQIKSWINR